jgi:pimeloyl-ACP methyl ester carboxylesterase
MAMKTGYRILTAVIISSIIPSVIYYINVVPYGHDPGELETILISVVQFIDFFLGFVCYWLIRNLFSKRWAILKKSTVNSKIFRFPIEKINHSELAEVENMQIQHLLNHKNLEIKFPVFKKHVSLFSEIIFPSGEKNKNILVFYCHGFNDSSAKIRYKTYALAELGYTIFAWDARGMGYSSKAGKKSDFLSRNMDAAIIVQYFSTIPQFQGYQFAIIGESMGGISAAYVLCQLPHIIRKSVLISTPSIFNEIFPRKVRSFSKKAIQRFSYRIKGIDPYPGEEMNKLLSPYFQFQDLQQKLSHQEWKNYTRSRILLIHSLTDGLISVQKCQENNSILQLDSQNLVLFETGNHNQIKNELGILSAIDNFLSST